MSRPHSAFQTETRLMFSLLRAYHHLDYARRGARTEAVPRALARVKEYLAGVVCPASPRVSTATLLKGGASQWLKTSLQILEGHYIEVIEEVKGDLGRVDGGDHRQAWEVATKWLVKKYKPVNPETVREAMEVVKGMGWEVGRLPGGADGASSAAPSSWVPPGRVPLCGASGGGVRRGRASGLGANGAGDTGMLPSCSDGGTCAAAGSSLRIPHSGRGSADAVAETGQAMGGAGLL